MWLAAGLPFAAAVKGVLKPQTIAQFAKEIGKNPQNVSAVIAGSARYPYEEIRDALAKRLGVTRTWLDTRCPRYEPAKREAKEPTT
jgi:hypothetical protein